MDCTHGTPGGARYCGLCRHAVMSEAGQLTKRPRYWETPLAKPMPDWYWAEVARARAEANRPTQPTLLEDL